MRTFSNIILFRVAMKMTSQFNRLEKETQISTRGTPDFSGLHEYKLLLRGSRDGFTPSDFHRLCDNKGPTVTIIKVKNTGQLIGGYNPSSWKSNGGYESADGAFIFSLGKESGDDVIQSK